VCIPKLIIAAMNLEKGSEIEVQRIEGGFIVTKATEGKEVRNIFD
jgi:antitoxin component of MazEF toxin-antitoxin module